MKKRLLSLLLVIVMVLGLIPATAMAAGTEKASGTVYVSAAFDGQFKDGMAYVPVELSELAEIDFEQYGLSDYVYDADGDGKNEVTALHLAVYAHEKVFNGSWTDVTVSGAAGSLYFAEGLFGWDENIRYNYNGEYPADESGWGITADQIVLSSGDFVDFASYSSWSFYSDSATGFHYFLDSSDAITHAYSTAAGEALTVKLGRAGADVTTGTGTAMAMESGYFIYYGTSPARSDAVSSVTTNDNGEAKITFETAGTYYLWADGAYGTENSDDIVSSPAYAVVTVTAAQQSDREPTPFSEVITVPSNGNSSWGYVSGLTLNGEDGDIYEAYWSSASNPYVLDVILTQGTPLDTTITAAFTVAGMRAPSISGETTVTLADGKGTISVTAVKGVSFYSDTNWTINLTVDDGSAANRPTYTVELPTEAVGYTVSAYNSESPIIGGRNFSFKVAIDGDYKKDENFAVKANGTELTPSGDVYTIENITENQTVTVEGVVEKTTADKGVTIIAPVGSTISCGKFYSYFKYDFSELLETTTLEDGRISCIFAVPGSESFLRVQHPDGVTYWDFERSGFSAGSSYEVTSDMLFIDSTEYTKETVYANFEKNTLDKADLYMTVNAQGWLDLDTGDTHSLNVFRNWIPVANSISNNGVSLPDVEYKVVSIDGTPSDVVTVTPDANNSCYADIKAEKAGTAIILVTYDAVYNNDGEGGKQFSAIWPENTGVIVVTVDAEDADIQTNITVNEEANAGGKQILDVEHDILFYVGNSGAEYSFKPEDGCTVSVARSTVGTTMTFNGFTTNGVVVAQDGTVTISGLTTGTHIIKVEKDGKTAYQVIRARGVSYELLHSDGTAVTADAPAEPGETITVQFHDLVSPMEKLSGVYNANFGFYYNGQDGDAIRTSGGTYGVYNFSGDETKQKFTFTVPAYWNEETYTLSDGGIKLGGYGSSFGAHRATSYLEGKEVNTNASGTAGVASVLPDIVVPTEPTGIPVYYVTLPQGEGYTVTAADGSSSPIQKGGSYTFSVSILGGYDANGMTVKVNGETVTLTDGSYTAENVTTDLNVTIEGVTKVTVETPEETTAIYTNGTDGSNWSDSTIYVNTVAVGGEGVAIDSYSWDGDVCTVNLSESTPVNATIVFTMTIGGSYTNWFKGATLNGTDMSPDAPCSVTLVDGKVTAEMTATCRGTTAGKTFIFTGARGEAIQPEPTTYTVTLPSGDGYTAAATESSTSPVTEGSSYSFTVTIAEGYEAGEDFAVKANEIALNAVEGVYTISDITADQIVTVEGVVEQEEETTLTWQEILEKTQAYLEAQANQTAPAVGSTNGEWQVLGLARNGMYADTDYFETYYQNVVDYVADKIDEGTGRLHASKSTDNSRVILALTALGKDVTDVGGYDLLQGLSDTDYVKKQGINGPVFALIALDSDKYDVPENADSSKQVTREWLINYILEKQLTAGGWALSGSMPDDMTPMAIQALAPYYKINEDVKSAVDKALDAMASMDATPETYAQMVVALSALGIDCEADERFNNVLDAMLAYAMDNGDGTYSFRRSSTESTPNQMTTEQAFYALVAYSRFQSKKTSLYDMSDVLAGYTITIAAAENGTVTADKKRAEAGTTVTLTITPAVGYELDTLTVPGTNVTVNGGTATFTMPAAAVTVTATFKVAENPVQNVIDAITALNVTKADAATQAKLKEIETAYNALTAEQKVQVTNYSAYTAAVNTFNTLLDTAKTKAQSELEAYFENLDEKDYTADNWKEIQQILSKALADIKNAENTDAIDQIIYYAKRDMADVADGDAITVTFRLIGDSQHDNGVTGHEEYMTWIPTTTYTMEPGSMMYDVFVQAISDYGLSQRGADNNYVESIRAPKCLGSYWLGEFDNGTNSGWMYTVNGKHPSVGLKAYELQDGDVIIWHYVDDYILEERTSSSKYYYRWLEAEDISPEEWLKKQDKDETNSAADFKDVSKSDWYYDDVQYVVSEGLFNGTGDNKFDPNASMNRAMLVTVLYRLEGEPKVTGSSEFEDVTANQWYTDAVIWATKNSIVNGYGDGKFGPTDNITREQMAAILYRYANYKKYDTSVSNSLTGYSDYSSISAYALKSMKWANAEKLITGRTSTTLVPQGTATRAEVAAILHRFVENVVNG